MVSPRIDGYADVSLYKDGGDGNQIRLCLCRATGCWRTSFTYRRMLPKHQAESMLRRFATGAPDVPKARQLGRAFVRFFRGI